MTGPSKQLLWVSVGLTHLALVALGAANVDLSKYGILGRAATYYGQISGSGDSYGFFAPGVWGQERALFDVVDQGGITRTIALETHASREADLRVGNVISQFQDDVENPEDLQRAVAASLAAAVFGRYPEARKVTVRLEEYRAVSMRDYRQGIRARWEPLYNASFIHRSEHL